MGCTFEADGLVVLVNFEANIPSMCNGWCAGLQLVYATA